MDLVISRAQSLPGWIRAGLAAGAGLLGAASQAPYGFAPAMLLMLTGGYLLWRICATARSAFGIGWVLGTAYFAATLRWILEPFQVDAAAHAWMAPFALVLLAAALAAFWGAAFALARGLGQGPALLLTWTAAEGARAYLFTGFPWVNPAQALLDTPLAQGLAFVGPHGMTLALCAVAWLCQRGHWSGLLAAGLVVAALVWPDQAPEQSPEQAPDQAPAQANTQTPGQPQSAAIIRIVQPNAPQDEKWDPDLAHVFVQRQLDFTAAAPAEDAVPSLVVWPESAIPYLASVAGPVFEFAAENAHGAPVLIGAQRDAGDDYFNSALLIGEGGAVTEIYDKHHLVPFGEYMPLPGLFRNLGIRALADRSDQGYSRGPGPELMDLGPLGQALILICYEAVFPQDTRTATRPDFIIQITNDAWFGASLGPQQHLALARMRAIELGLPLVRAANTGISAMIGPRGEIREALPLDQAGYIDTALPAPLPETLYARTGDRPVFLLLALALALSLAFSLRRRLRH